MLTATMLSIDMAASDKPPNRKALQRGDRFDRLQVLTSQESLFAHRWNTAPLSTHRPMTARTIDPVAKRLVMDFKSRTPRAPQMNPSVLLSPTSAKTTPRSCESILEIVVEEDECGTESEDDSGKKTPEGVLSSDTNRLSQPTW
mmetsp:Transcript_7676/g.23234  ORF Transcript_7676/g.23234 Transcript_7676/m.23234 type:complete len:144 (-) Transcript_7676:266-697(-)